MAHRISKLKKELQTLGVKELQSRLRELEEHSFQLRMQFKTGQLAATSTLAFARKEIARVKTAIGVRSRSS